MYSWCWSHCCDVAVSETLFCPNNCFRPFMYYCSVRKWGAKPHNSRVPSHSYNNYFTLALIKRTISKQLHGSVLTYSMIKNWSMRCHTIRFISPTDERQMNDFLQNYGPYCICLFIYVFILFYRNHYSNLDKPRMSVPIYEITWGCLTMEQSKRSLEAYWCSVLQPFTP